MLQISEAHPNWPVYADVFEYPPPRLASRHPVWSDMTSVDTIMQCRKDWSSASVVNHTIITDPTIRQPCFDLPRHTWSLMNRFRTCLAQIGSHPITFLWLWPVTDHEPHCWHLPINEIWRWTESTPRSRWWWSHITEIFSDCSTHEINNEGSLLFGVIFLFNYANLYVMELE